MPPASILLVLVTVAVAMEVLPDAAVFVGEGKSLTLTLERTSHNGVEMSQLRDRDRVRHVRFLQQQLTGVVDFQVEGTYDPFIVGYNFSHHNIYRYRCMCAYMYTRINWINSNKLYWNYPEKQERERNLMASWLVYICMFGNI